MAHEMRNPVNAIQSSAELLERDLPAEVRKEAVRDIKAETGRMSQTINKLLNIAALEKRNSLKELTQIEVRHILNEIDDRFRNVMADKGIALSIDAPSDLKIYCDPDLLVQALGNLVQNSIEHSESGTRIDLFVFEHGNKIEFQIIDQGEGIPEYALPHLFDKFYSIKAKGKGTGLGLSLVLEVADLHYGAISIRNHDSGGVIAILTIAK
jgi:two-component system sensor histidine kinase CreC